MSGNFMNELKKKAYNELDLRDFALIKDVTLQEALDEETLAEGIEPMVIMFKVAITRHAYDRMYNCDNRYCDWEMVEDLIREKGNQLLDVRNGEEFVMLNDKETLAVVCSINIQEGMCIIAVHTVIRKVYSNRYNIEAEAKVFIDKEKNTVL